MIQAIDAAFEIRLRLCRTDEERAKVLDDAKRLAEEWAAWFFKADAPYDEEAPFGLYAELMR